ncbi:hypothetical protein ACFL2H_03120 [Planctomycetota bacterium]
MRMLTTLTFALLLCPAAFGAEPIGVTNADVNHSRDRLAKLFRVNQTTIDVTPKRSFTSAVVRLDLYRDGTKTKSIVAAATKHVGPQESAAISLQIADLDYLSFADGPSDSLRFLTELETNGSGPPMHASQTHDIPKSLCTMSQVSGASSFTDRSAFDNAIPLCWMLSTANSGTKKVSSGRNPKELLKRNPKSDIVIVSILLTDAAKE